MKTQNLVTVIILLVVFYCCKSNINDNEVSDNIELEKMVQKDQETRQSQNDEPLESIDKEHRKRVLEMLAQGKIKTVNDKYNAALILQHTNLIICNGKLMSISSENYYLAYALSKSAMELGSKGAGTLAAATYDRYLLYTEGYQKYGTQKVYEKETDQMIWAPIDSVTSDEEREKFGVKPLLELLKECKMQRR